MTTSTHIITTTSKIKTIVYADRDRLEQVLTNLINNAVKYSPKGTEVIVAVSKNKTSVSTCVSDFGIGIPEKDKEKIFDRFYRVNEEETHTFSGLGLGLYISAQIIERLKGKIYVTSKPGNGSTFCFTIPIKPKT
jgi:signal transduction histidine kinase